MRTLRITFSQSAHHQRPQTIHFAHSPLQDNYVRLGIELRVLAAAQETQFSPSFPRELPCAPKTTQSRQQMAHQAMAELGAGGGFEVTPLTTCSHVAGAVLANGADLHELPSTCESCDGDELWLCLHCLRAGCSRYQNGHASLHAAQSTHALALSLSDSSVWCFSCDAYIDLFNNPELHGIFTAYYRHRFGEEPVLPGVLSLESAGAAHGGAGAEAAPAAAASAPAAAAPAPTAAAPAADTLQASSQGQDSHTPHDHTT